MKLSWMEVLKNTLVRSLEYLYGKDEKKMVLSNPKQSRGDIQGMSPSLNGKKKNHQKGIVRAKQSVCEEWKRRATHQRQLRQRSGNKREREIAKVKLN